MKQVTVEDRETKDAPEDFQERPNPQAVGGGPRRDYSMKKLPSTDNIKSVTATPRAKFDRTVGHIIVFDVAITRTDGKVETVEMHEGDWQKFRTQAGIEMGR